LFVLEANKGLICWLYNRRPRLLSLTVLRGFTVTLELR